MWKSSAARSRRAARRDGSMKRHTWRSSVWETASTAHVDSVIPTTTNHDPLFGVKGCRFYM